MKERYKTDPIGELDKNLKKSSSMKLQESINNNLSRTTKADEKASKILRDLAPGEQISVKDIKKIYGKNWKKSLACTPLEGQVAKRDKKKAKAKKKSRQKNRRK